MKFLLICVVLICNWDFIKPIKTSDFHKSKLTRVNESIKPKCTVLIDDPSFVGNKNDPNLFLLVNVLLINNTDDTAKYVSTSCLYSKYYTVDNANMIFANDDCMNSGTICLVIPPHRSTRWFQTQVKFKFHKMPDTTFRFKIGMRVLQWKSSYSATPPDEKEIKSAELIWSEEELFRTNKQHEMLGHTRQEDEAHTLRKPWPICHQLTDQDRKNYVLSIDQEKFQKRTQATIGYEKYESAYVPLTLTNKSKDTLKYINFNCSWWEIYQTNINKIRFVTGECNYNFPVEIDIAPQKSTTINMLVSYDKKALGDRRRFKIGMTLQKYINREQVMDFEPAVYLLKPETSNLIWSNEVKIP